MKSKIPTEKEMKEYEKYLKKEAEKFKLTSEDLSNLYDLGYMIGDDVYDTLELNNMLKWFHNFHQRIEKIVIPELYEENTEKKKFKSWVVESIPRKKERPRLRRPCIRCGKMYLPTGKAEKLCKSCFTIRRTGKPQEREK